jgi:hypothetical protein
MLSSTLPPKNAADNLEPHTGAMRILKYVTTGGELRDPWEVTLAMDVWFRAKMMLTVVLVDPIELI